MYAIVDIAGQQFKVEKDNKMFVHRLDNKEGSQVSFDKVLLLDIEGNVTVGQPTVDGASVVAKVVAHVKGDKVLVFKKKRRKGYQVLNGHRQFFTEIVVEDILEKGQKAKASASKPTDKEEKTEAKTKEADKPADKKEAPKAETKEAKAEVKKTEAKAETKKAEAKTETKKTEPKEEEKKAAPKKTTAKKAAPAKAKEDKGEDKPAKKAAPKAEDDKKKED